ncbi:MAG: ThiF family adenylyltransferase [Chloroflexi bacterium]|uniref:HesA/MoeB/ThiF family protein n=1 Tax=Candidatus Flexifilum breve TaxID=3140694 RepID=UPI003136C2F8|nr:ThiF family adenylyltransferase [Chloroflexota bacterium]
MEPLVEVIDVEQENRYSRLLQAGWNLTTLQSARVLVAGAGALGNEVIKNLALIGVKAIYIVDFDRIEETNLSRSVLFRAGDVGKPKAQMAAERAHPINPDVELSWLHGDLTWQIGVGVFRRMNAVIGCLDNRAARLWINRYCWRVGIPWFEGALDGLNGHVHLFGAAQAPCYECILTEQDRALLWDRVSCTGVARSGVFEGTIPTTPTGASLIAALQVQEVIRWLHGMPVEFGTGIVYTSTPPNLQRFKLPERADCISHEKADPLIELPEAAAAAFTLRDLLHTAQRHFDDERAALRFDNNEVVSGLLCSECGNFERWFGSILQVSEALITCPHCHSSRRPLSEGHIGKDYPYLELKLSEVGIPPGHIIHARCGNRDAYFN